MFTTLLFNVLSSREKRTHEFSTWDGFTFPLSPEAIEQPVERVHFSDSKGACATPSLGGSGERQVVSSPQPEADRAGEASPQSCSSAAFTSPPISILKLQGLREARPPGHHQTRLPLLEQAILPLPPDTTANRDPLHTTHVPQRPP